MRFDASISVQNVNTANGSLSYLVGVVGAGDQQEDPGEGVLGWIGNLPGLRPLREAKESRRQTCVSYFKQSYFVPAFTFCHNRRILNSH